MPQYVSVESHLRLIIGLIHDLFVPCADSLMGQENLYGPNVFNTAEEDLVLSKLV